MNDSLVTAAGAGVPDFGMRLTALVIAAFVVVVGMLLIYFRMQDADRKPP